MQKTKAKGGCRGKAVLLATERKEISLESTNRRAFVAKKKSKKHLVLTDNEGRVYCSKCGRADFDSTQSAYGHLSQCRGYKAEVKKFKEIINDIQGDSDMAGINRPSSLTDEINADVALSSSASIFSEKTQDEGLTQTLPRPYLDPASGPRVGGVESSFRFKEAQKDALIAHLSKLAFNHNQHVHPVRSRQTFSGPMDIVGDFYQETKKNEPLFRIISLGIILWGALFLYEKFEKLNNKGKNKRK